MRASLRHLSNAVKGSGYTEEGHHLVIPSKREIPMMLKWSIGAPRDATTSKRGHSAVIICFVVARAGTVALLRKNGVDHEEEPTPSQLRSTTNMSRLDMPIIRIARELS